MTPDPFFNSLPEIAPAQLAELTGLDANLQRSWRHRGYIEGLGTLQENGRWLYDWFDVLIIAMMQKLYERGVELSHAKEFAGTVGAPVFFWSVSAHRPISDQQKPKHVAFLREGGEWTARKVFGGQLPEAEACFLVDCELLAASLSAPIRAKIKELA